MIEYNLEARNTIDKDDNMEKLEKMDKREMILNGNMYKTILVLSFPIMINNLIQTIYNLVDGIWVSKISSVHFAATAFVFPVMFFFISFGMGLSIAGTSILSQLVGGDKMEEAKEYASQLIVITLLSSIAFTIIGYIISPSIIRLMGGTGEFAEYANIYLRIMFLNIPFMFLFFNVNSLMNSQGDTITPMLLSAGSAIINVVLDPIFIFTFNWGIAGAAWATVLSRVVLAFVGVGIIFGKKNKIKPSFKAFKFDKEKVKKIVSVGLPISLGQTGASLGFILLNGFIASYGTATLAAFAMVNRITSLVMQPAMGMGVALTSIVGQNIGADQVKRAKEAFQKAFRLSIIIGIVGCVILIAFDTQIINFFMQSDDDPSVIQLALTYLIYISLSMPLMGMFSVFKGLFQGSGHTKYSMAMEIGRLWFVRIPMILIFKHFTDLGSAGIWFSMSFSNLVICIYGYIVYRQNKWQEKIVKKEKFIEITE